MCKGGSLTGELTSKTGGQKKIKRKRETSAYDAAEGECWGAQSTTRWNQRTPMLGGEEMVGGSKKKQQI